MTGDTPSNPADPGESDSIVHDIKDIEELTTQLKELTDAWNKQRQLRNRNISPDRPDEEALKKLDSSVKRNNALIKKLRLLSSDNKDQLCEELSRVNQSKYISEAVAAIADASLKVSDVAAAVASCSQLHQRYAEFSSLLIPTLGKIFSVSAKLGAEEERNLVKRRRSVLKLLHELLVVGVYSNSQLLVNIVRDLANVDFESDKEAGVTALTLLSGFVKSAREHILDTNSSLQHKVQQLLQQTETADGLAPETKASLEQLKSAHQLFNDEAKLRFTFSPAAAEQLLKHLDKCFESACTALLEEQAALRQLEQDNQRILATKGELPEDVSAEYQTRRKTFESLQRAVAGLAEALQRSLPELVDQGITRVGTADQSQQQQQGEDGPLPLFDDQETRAFYLSLPDLRSLVPAVLLGDAGDSKDGSKSNQNRKSQDPSTSTTNTATTVTATAPSDADSSTVSAAPQPSQTSASSPAATKIATASSVSKVTANGVEESEQNDDGKAEGTISRTTSSAGATSTAAADRAQLEQILQLLPSCVSRDLADDIAVNFCYVNTKGNRKKMIRALCDVPKAGLQLLPFYARVTAALGQIFPDIIQGVILYLEDEFASLLARKDPTAITLEPRVRNARYLAELCKFQLLSPPLVFSHLKQLLDDFSHHNVDAAAALVETCGPFLLRLPEAKARMENMLEMMNRLKNVRNLDPRQTAVVDSAYFVCKAPEKLSRQRVKRSPVQEYIRHLIFVVLEDDTITTVLKKLLKLPWTECERFVLKCLLKVVRGRFQHIPLIAALAAGLSKFRGSISVAMVDCLLDEVRCGLESPATHPYQRRVADVRLLGELYNYSLLDSRTVFDTLYLILSFGHESPESTAALDPVDDFFRIRLIFHLLDVCGEYFSSGSARKRLDRFLTFFQAYTLTKQQPLPLDIEFDIQDLMHNLRPGWVRFSSLEEAAEAVNTILEEEEVALASGLGGVDDDDSDEEEHEGMRVKARVREREEVEGRAAGGVKEVALEDDMDDVDGREEEVDEDFEKELASIMHECQGKPLVTLEAPRAGVGVRPGVAVGAATGRHGSAHASHGSAHASHAQAGTGDVNESSVAFKMLMKKGGKDDKSKELQVPVTASMAISLKKAERSEAAERDEIKRLVLAANKREEQEQLAAIRGRHRYSGQYSGRQYRQNR